MDNFVQSTIDWIRQTPEWKEDDRKYRTARFYHLACETFDRLVCSEFDKEKNEAMPMSQVEWGRIETNAREVRKFISIWLNISEKELFEGLRIFWKNHPKGLL